jgi:hypothetical protein
LDDGALIVVRIGVLALLYLFLLAALRLVWRDLAHAAPARTGSVGRATLMVVEGLQGQFRAGDRIPVEGAASIGRDSDNQVVVRDGAVSGRHCALFFREGRWWIEDLGSTNGTWVNDRQTGGPLALESGDLVQVGRAAFRFNG